jgi:hypothetical protein
VSAAQTAVSKACPCRSTSFLLNRSTFPGRTDTQKIPSKASCFRRNKTSALRADRPRAIPTARVSIYQQRQAQPRRLNDSARFSLILCSRLCNWKEALIIVKRETLIGLASQGF